MRQRFFYPPIGDGHWQIYSMNKIFITSVLVVGVLLRRGGDFFVDAFIQRVQSTPEWPIRPTTLQLARKYIVIGGNIDGIDPNKEEDTYSMSKKERKEEKEKQEQRTLPRGNTKRRNQLPILIMINLNKRSQASDLYCRER